MTQPVPAYAAAPAADRPGPTLRIADAVIFAGALLVLVFSFLPQLSVDAGFGTKHTENMWHTPHVSGDAVHFGNMAEVLAVPLLALVIAGFAALVVFVPTLGSQKLLVAKASEWRDVLSIVPVLTALFALFYWHGLGGIGWAAYLVLVAALVLFLGAALPGFVPALAAPLGGGARSGGAVPQQPQGWGQPAPQGWNQPAPPQQGWGQPAAPSAPQAPAAPQPAAAPPVWGTPPASAGPLPPTEPIQQSGPSGAPPAAPAAPTPPPSAPEPAAAPAAPPTIISPQRPADLLQPPVPTPPPSAPSAPFWACFPTVRPLLDPASGQQIGQVTPEEWFLVTAVDGRGAQLQTADGRAGLLVDVTGMVRADG